MIRNRCLPRLKLCSPLQLQKLRRRPGLLQLQLWNPSLRHCPFVRQLQRLKHHPLQLQIELAPRLPHPLYRHQVRRPTTNQQSRYSRHHGIGQGASRRV